MIGSQVIAIAVGVISSVIASSVWLFGLRRMRPVIDISPWIVEDDTASGAPTCYRIKIINRSRRALVDVAFELAVMRPERTQGGVVKMRRVVPVSGPPPLIIPGRGRGDDANTYRIRVDADLRGILDGDAHRFIRLRVFARDEVTGIGRVVEREYYEPRSDLRAGKYSKGQSFEVVGS
ncbi:hypothetical protein [Micromonospora palomenae]|uniref:hypothetical protein n=1 Tax=Micromonospora palomenae TaxID=1461247 RepID=UPI003F8BD5D1